MNQRLNISDLAALLAEYTGKDKKNTELFLRELFVVISDALLEEHIVKVKGLGTFKVIKVEERESIHVNTGERFLIPSHSKFTFTPDKELKEQVNKPFASFETTELNEGVMFSATPDEDARDDSEGMDEESVTTEPATEEVQAESLPEVVAETGNVKKEKTETPQPEPEQPQQEIKDLGGATTANPKKGSRLLYVLLLILFIIVAGSFYYFYNKPSGKQEVITEVKDDVEVGGKADEQPFSPDSTVADTDTVIMAKPETSPPAVETQPKKVVVEKIVPDSRLTLISLKHYGHKVFWVYIYEHNKAIVKNPNSIQIGTELIIPDASLYDIDAKNPESVAKAKAKQAEINSKF